jgi:hypothetical protein
LGDLELIAELPPKRSLDKMARVASRLLELADSLDVPDAPLGAPAPSSPVMAAAIRSALGGRADLIAHLRLLDVSPLGVVNIAMSMEAAGVSRLLLLRGDRPALGDPCNTDPEAMAAVIRSLGIRVRVGHLLSLAKPMDQVLRRASSGADFYVITRPWRSGLVSEVVRGAHLRGSKLYVYLVLLTEANADALRSIPREELVTMSEVREAIERLRGVVDGVIVSSPRDLESQLSALREARAAL